MREKVTENIHLRSCIDRVVVGVDGSLLAFSCFSPFLCAQVPHRGGDRTHVVVKKFREEVNARFRELTSQKGYGWESIRNFTQKVCGLSVRVPLSPTRA